MKTAFAILAAASMLALPSWGCAASAPRKVTSVRHGKPAAPVDISATLSADRAQIEVKFLAVATSVDVRVNGANGLVVTSTGAPITGSFAKGDSASALVTFTPPPGRADLVVTVVGVFNGSRSAKTASFTVGSPSPGAEKPSTGVQVEPNGDRVKELPGERR